MSKTMTLYTAYGYARTTTAELDHMAISLGWKVASIIDSPGHIRCDRWADIDLRYGDIVYVDQFGRINGATIDGIQYIVTET